MTIMQSVAKAMINPNQVNVPTPLANQSTLTGIINAIIGLLGAVAVIFIVIGAILYITSSGDAGATSKAKNTILFAIIGLIITVLAYGIVNFVVGKF